MSSLRVQVPEVFFFDLIETIRRAKRRVYIETMIFESGEYMDTLGSALIDAAKRGLEVKLIYDWVSYRLVHGEIHFFPMVLPHQQKHKEQIHKRTDWLVGELRQAGGKVMMTNHPILWEYVFPVTNRNHSKLYLVDDFCGWIGGVNLFDKALGFADCMVKVFSLCLIEGMAEYFLAIWHRSFKSEYVLSCGAEYKLYLDSGRPGRSLIYQTGLDMVSRAQKSIVFVSQFVPNGPFLRRLLMKANDGVGISVITSHREEKMFTGIPYRFFYEYFCYKNRKNGSISLVHYDRKVHAKILIVDGKEVMMGSHNMAFSGVLFGTQEISLWSKDRVLVEQLIVFYKKLLESI